MNKHKGTDGSEAVQQTLRSMIDAIDTNPILSNGGRALSILDPDAYGWSNVQRAVDKVGIVTLMMVPRDTLQKLATHFEGVEDFPVWEGFTGTTEDILPACQTVLNDMALPHGWTISHHVHPDGDVTRDVQTLNRATGVAPLPTYFLQSRHKPSLTTCLRDTQGALMACANGTMRFHSQGPLAGHLFAGLVSVAPSHRRKGLGACVNAAMIAESHRLFGWSTVLELAKADNRPSVAMITKCGLRHVPERVAFAVSPGRGYVTR